MNGGVRVSMKSSGEWNWGEFVSGRLTYHIDTQPGEEGLRKIDTSNIRC